MEFNSSPVYCITWNGVEYKFRKPKVKEARKHAEVISKLDEKKDAHKFIDATIKYYEELGLPSEVSEEMEMDHLTAIGKVISGADTKGK